MKIPPTLSCLLSAMTLIAQTIPLAQPSSLQAASSATGKSQNQENEPADLYSKDLSKKSQAKRALVANISVGFKPLTELGNGDYKGQKGGLYGNGSNDLPPRHRALLQQKMAEIKPLDHKGMPAADGKVVLLTLGMSNTSQEARSFIQLAAGSSEMSPHVIVVDGAQGAQGSMQWSTTTNRSMDVDPWEIVEKRLQQKGVSANQVQAVWLKAALMGVAKYGLFPKHAEVLQESISTTIQIAHKRYPNLKVAYLSSRIYGGYSPGGNREPFAYESAFSVRGVILKQIRGDKELNCNPSQGPVKAPVIVWGPYLWADGMTPRQSDGLIWKPSDLRSDDGMHPSDDGQQKVGEMLLDFFSNDATAAWFRRS